MGEQSEQHNEVEQQLQQQLSDILTRPLNPANIDTYASEALSDVIDLAAKAQSAFRQEVMTGEVDSKTLETAAFEHFDLGDVNDVLNYLSAKDEEIRQLDTVIAHARLLPKVLVPPDDLPGVPPGPGMSPLEEKQEIPRLKTVLFVLHSRFNIDVSDRTSLQLSRGEVSSDSMRGASYVLVETNDRAILVCDEEENATFVFDKSALAELNIGAPELMDMHKSELNDLVQAIRTGAQKINYSDHFVENAVQAIEAPQYIPPKSVSNSASLLIEPFPDDHTTVHKLATKLRVSQERIKDFIHDHPDEVGEVKVYMSRSTPGVGLSPSQQAVIEAGLRAEGGLRPNAPEGYKSIGQIATAFGTDKYVIKRRLSQLGESIGDVEKYRFGKATTEGYSPAQQALIQTALESSGFFAAKAPDGYEPIRGIQDATGISHRAIESAIDSLGDSLGEVANYRPNSGGSASTSYYSPGQQGMILDELERRGLFVPSPPDGYLSIPKLSKLWGVDRSPLEKAVQSLGDKLGEITEYRHGRFLAPAYGPEQQAMIKEAVASRGLFAEKHPEGYLSPKGIADTYGYNKNTVRKAIQDLSDQLGTVEQYRFGTAVTYGYSPEQQRVIVSHLEEIAKPKAQA